MSPSTQKMRGANVVLVASETYSCPKQVPGVASGHLSPAEAGSKNLGRFNQQGLGVFSGKHTV